MEYSKETINNIKQIIYCIILTNTWLLLMLIFSIFLIFINPYVGLNYLLVIIGFLFSTVGHELFHLITIKKFKVKIHNISPSFTGVNISFNKTKYYKIIAISGVMFNFTFLLFLTLILFTLNHINFLVGSINILTLQILITYNFILLFNILPIFPDGKLYWSKY